MHIKYYDEEYWKNMDLARYNGETLRLDPCQGDDGIHYICFATVELETYELEHKMIYQYSIIVDCYINWAYYGDPTFTNIKELDRVKRYEENEGSSNSRGIVVNSSSVQIEIGKESIIDDYYRNNAIRYLEGKVNDLHLDPGVYIIQDEENREWKVTVSQNMRGQTIYYDGPLGEATNPQLNIHGNSLKSKSIDGGRIQHLQRVEGVLTIEESFIAKHYADLIAISDDLAGIMDTVNIKLKDGQVVAEALDKEMERVWNLVKNKELNRRLDQLSQAFGKEYGMNAFNKQTVPGLLNKAGQRIIEKGQAATKFISKAAPYAGKVTKALMVIDLFVNLLGDSKDSDEKMNYLGEWACSLGCSIAAGAAAGAVGGPAGIVIGVAAAVFDMALLGLTGHGAGYYVWEFVKFVGDILTEYIFDPLNKYVVTPATNKMAEESKPGFNEVIRSQSYGGGSVNGFDASKIYMNNPWGL